jgi:glutamyl-tRNA reductase
MGSWAKADGGRGTRIPAVERASLTTCNRVELYALLEEDIPPAALMDAVCADSEVEPRRIVERAFVHRGVDAVRHLFRVASGLESAVLGEPQILGQVSEAHRGAAAAGTLGPVLDTVFRRAVRAGRRARRETGIGRAPASVSSAAVALAARSAGDLRERRVLVIGAGEMATAALFALHSRGVRVVTVVNRSAGRATVLARRFGYHARPLSQLAAALADADIVVSATGAPQPIVDMALAEGVVVRRDGAPVVFIDIAVPRDVDPRIRAIPGIELFDTDDIHAGLDEGIEARRREVPKVMRLIEDELAVLDVKLRELAVRPVIGELCRRAEQVRREQLEELLDGADDLDAATRAHLDQLTRAFVRAMLREPTRALHRSAREAGDRDLVEAMMRLLVPAPHGNDKEETRP